MEETLIDVTELFDIKIMNQVYAQACIQACTIYIGTISSHNFSKNEEKPCSTSLQSISPQMVLSIDY